MEDLPEDNVSETAKLLRDQQRAVFLELLGSTVDPTSRRAPSVAGRAAIVSNAAAVTELGRLTVAERLAIGDRTIRALQAHRNRLTPLAVLDAMETVLDADEQSQDEASVLMRRLVSSR